MQFVIVLWIVICVTLFVNAIFRVASGKGKKPNGVTKVTA